MTTPVKDKASTTPANDIVIEEVVVLVTCRFVGCEGADDGNVYDKLT